MARTLTPAEQVEYVTRAYGRCPYCGSGDLEGDSIEVDTNRATQPVVCLTCSRQWTDVYTLSGIEEEP